MLQVRRSNYPLQPSFGSGARAAVALLGEEGEGSMQPEPARPLTTSSGCKIGKKNKQNTHIHSLKQLVETQLGVR